MQQGGKDEVRLITTFTNQYDYYDGLGFLRYSQQSNGTATNVTQYRPDDQSRAVYAIDPMNNRTTVVYDEWGNQKEALDTYGNLYVTENRPKARKSLHYFVAAGNVTAYRSNVNQNNLKSSYLEKDYDQWGRLAANRVYKDWPNTSTPISELYTYDVAGNVVTYVDPKRNTNNDGVTTKYSYDVLNRLVEVKDALGQISKYQYDTNGQVISSTIQASELDAPQVISSKTYNEIGGLTSKSDAFGNQDTSIYNNQGLASQRLDRNGTTFKYEYDEQNRPTLITASSGGTVQQNKTIIGSSGILKDTQELYKNSAKTASLTSTIDYLKRVTNIQILGGSSFSSTLGISYDNNSRITQYAAGASSVSFYTNYKYVSTRLDKVQTNGLSTVNDADSVNVKYTYYPNGQVWKITYPTLLDGSILQTEYIYNSLNQVKTITNKKGSTILSSSSYLYDANGNIESVTETTINKPVKTSTYTYDKLNRLLTISRSDGSSASYTYDVRGNRLTQLDIRDSILGLEDASFGYDLNNMLISATKNGISTTFEYAPDGLRYKKTTGTDIKQYRYNANGEVISEVNSSNAATANYVRGDRLLVKKDVGTNKDYYYLYNGHGDVIQIIDTNGNIVNSYVYDEWGNVTQQTEQIANVFKYAGEVLDSETGLYYLRARYYDPTMGRFINEDTYEGQIDNPLTLNLYTYVGNNPLIRTDPSGNKWYYLWIDDAAKNIWNAAESRTSAMQSNPNWYTIGNWATLGTFDTVKGTFAPEKPLSLQHWVDSASTAFLVFGFGKGVSSGAASSTYNAIKAGALTGSLDGLTAAEKTVINDLLSQGKNVSVIPRSTTSKTPDFLINGVKTELKTLSNANVNTAITRIQDGFKQGAQTVIIDARGTTMTSEQVTQIMNRAAGTYKDKVLPGKVEIWIK